ncbi:CsbD family protein [Kordiimonas sp.]|uniref:CsbD family protein n=1 Tax=Kordiimonas sp. TaxID=1970157 RepID=UPI003A9509C3
MNKEIFEGKWNQLKGSVQTQWGKLTDDEIDKIEGDATKLCGLLQERYGKSKEAAEAEIEAWQLRHNR